MRFLLLILCYVLAIHHTKGCPTKESAEDCFFKVADSNHDGYITKHELERAIYPRLGWFQSGAFRLFGGIQRILDDCDQNKDHKLTKKESLEMSTCLDSCFKRSKTIEIFNC